MHGEEQQDSAEDKEEYVVDGPEEGIVVMNAEEKDGKVKSTFYESAHTLETYSQCSYSACRGGRCKDRGDIENKMKKWRSRLESNATFACAVMDPYEEYKTELLELENDEPEHGGKSYMLLKLAVFVYFGVLAIMLVVLIVRRCKANKLYRMRTATPTPVTKEAPTMTKEQEANLPPQYYIKAEDDEGETMPPSAPAVVWTTNALPTYEKASELPPEYKSTPDMKTATEAWVPEEEETKEKPKDSEA